MVEENSDIIMASLAKNPKKKPEESRAVLLVSINGENKGDNFAATSDMLKSLNFKELVILVACELQMDTLYGLGLADNIEEARNIAKKRGDDWVEQHKKYLKEFVVLRWGKFTSNDQYDVIKKETDNLFINHKKIGDSLSRTGKEFVLRYKEIGSVKFDDEKLLRQSMSYIKNESPIIPYFMLHGFDYILYNNSPNYTFQTLLEYYNKDETKISWLRFDFSARKAATLKMNAIQTKKHGFSCDRNDLENFIRKRTSNVLFFKDIKNDLAFSEQDDKTNLVLNLIDQQVNVLANTIKILPAHMQKSAYQIISEKLLAIDNSRNDFDIK